MYYSESCVLNLPSSFWSLSLSRTDVIYIIYVGAYPLSGSSEGSSFGKAHILCAQALATSSQPHHLWRQFQTL